MNPITTSCFFSVFEIGKVGAMYLDTISNWHWIVNNFMHKMGTLYDVVMFAIDHHNGEVSDARENQIWWWKLGICVGTLIQEVLYTPVDATPFDPLGDYGYPTDLWLV